MKGDFTRPTFDRARRYSGVRMQQGRVLLDADWNEQLDIQRGLDARSTADAVGAYGVPSSAPDGFQVFIADGVPSLRAGRVYVDGVLCENDAARPIAGLPDSAEAPPGTLDFGHYLAFLDVWQTGVTALEDPSIREVGLLGADTATRDRTVWQVRWAPFTPGADDVDDPVTWITRQQQRRASEVARMTARVRDGEATGFASCSVPTTAGYQRQENLLYRVEVHTAGTGGTARVKWSRDNGATAARCTRLDLSVAATPALTLGGVDRERLLAFEVGDHVELTTDAREVARSPGAFAVVVDRDLEQQRLHVELLAGEPALTGWFEDPAAGVVDGRKVRRWESAPVTVSAAGTGGMSDEIPLGSHGTDDGLVLQFKVDAGGPQRFHVGDYWLIPARASTGAIEWPREGASAALLRPHGPAHRYAPLALLEHVAGGAGAWHVRRDYLFHARCAPLAAQRRLVYCGEALPKPGSPGAFGLTLRVADGALPVEGATVLIGTWGGTSELLGGDSPSAWAGEIRATSATGGVVYWEARLKPDEDFSVVTAQMLGVTGEAVGEAVAYVLRAPRFRLRASQLLLDFNADSGVDRVSGTGQVTQWTSHVEGSDVVASLPSGNDHPVLVRGGLHGRSLVRFSEPMSTMSALAVTGDALGGLDQAQLTVYVVGTMLLGGNLTAMIGRRYAGASFRWGFGLAGTGGTSSRNAAARSFSTPSDEVMAAPGIWVLTTEDHSLRRNLLDVLSPITAADVTYPFGTAGDILIGAGNYDIARILVYQGTHDEQTRSDVLAYLAQEYRLLLDRAS